MDKLKAMKVFVEIADMGSLTAAANSLETSLTSVVRTLAALEEHLKVRLFNRNTRQIAITDEGREYYLRCRTILAEVSDAESMLIDRQAEPLGKVTVTAPVTFGKRHVAPKINAYLNQYQKMQVNLVLLDRPVDILMTPVGGGGLLSGSAIAVKDHKNRASTLVIGAEPEAADDAWRGFKTGIRVTESTPCTIADGLRGTLGERNFKIIMHRVDGIFLASETRIIEAMRLLWTRLKILVEPSAAVPLAAIMQQPEKFSGKRVAIVLSGGNLDLDALPW